MGLVDDLRTDRELRAPWQTCSVKWALSLTEGEDERALRTALEDDSISGKQISDALRDNLNIRVGGESIRRHRRRTCMCEQ